MSFESAVLLAGLGLVLLTLIVTFVLFRLNQKKFSLTFAISHLIFVVIMSAIYFPGEKDAQHQLFWLIPGVYDLPISLTYFYLGVGSMAHLAIAFATVGTFQYLIIGWTIDLIRSKNRKELLPSKGMIISVALFVIVTFVLGVQNYRYDHLPPFNKAEIELKNAKDEETRFYELSRAAKTGFEAKEYEKAKIYANELLSLAKKYPKDWNYGNAIYNGNIVLGRLSLLDGNISSAKEYLLSAAKTPGSPQLDTFGPNMTLARDLLGKGENKAVINFLEQCRVFWEENDGKLDLWITEIQEGKTPEFGPNLLY